MRSPHTLIRITFWTAVVAAINAIRDVRVLSLCSCNSLNSVVEMAEPELITWFRTVRAVLAVDLKVTIWLRIVVHVVISHNRFS